MPKGQGAHEGWRRWVGLSIGILVAGVLLHAAEDKKKERESAPRPAAKVEARPAAPAQGRPGAMAPMQGRPGAMAPMQGRPGAMAPMQGRPGGMAPMQGRPGGMAPMQGRPGLQPGGTRMPERQVARTRGGGEIQRGPGGMVREVRTPGGAIIRHAPGGGRSMEVVRPGGRMVYARGGGHYGYVQGPFRSHGMTFNQRTYVRDGRVQARIYRPWGYGGREYQIYTPNHYYRAGFYTWAYTPWARPVYYGWGWNTRPWYGYYGAYFTPYPYYQSPAYWLTDYVIATTLESAYLAQGGNGGAPPAYGAALSPEAKEVVAREVRRQMDQERNDQAYAQNPGPNTAPPMIFSPMGPRAFLVSGDVTAYVGNQEMPLLEGDVIQAAGPITPSSEYAQVAIVASRGGLPRGTYASVRTMDLQEMQNHLQATLDQGLEQLQTGQGQNGMPAVPPQETGVVKAAYTDDIHPDDQAERELSAVVDDANRAEQDVLSQGAQAQAPALQARPAEVLPPAEPAAAPTGGPVVRGMSIGEVESALGAPASTMNLGPRQIYLYPNLKVTFVNGLVSDVR